MSIYKILCDSVLLIKGLADLTSPDLQVTIIYELSCINSCASCSVGHLTSCIWSELYTTVSLSYVIQYIRFHLLFFGSELFLYDLCKIMFRLSFLYAFRYLLFQNRLTYGHCNYYNGYIFHITDSRYASFRFTFSLIRQRNHCFQF